MSESSWDPLCDLVVGWFGRVGGRRCVAVAGGVATGKSTFAERLAQRAPDDVVVVAADDFLLSNRDLAAKRLSARKGWPETYDLDGLAGAVRELAEGRPTTIPSYSHREYDVVDGGERVVGPAPLVVVEGLHVLGAASLATSIDLGVYLDAPERVARQWYLARAGSLIEQAESDPGSFYSWALGLDEASVQGVLDTFWREINLVVLRDHVAPTSDAADLVVHLDESRSMTVDIGPTMR